MAKSYSNRIICTPSAYARKHYLYVQEVGTLQSLEPHVSSRRDLNSCLFFTVLKGCGQASYNGFTHTLRTGDCIWIDCTKPYSHESSASDPWSLSWVHFFGLTAGELYHNFLLTGNFYLFHPRSIAPFTDTLMQLYRLQAEKSSFAELCSNKYLTDLVTLCYTENHTNSQDEASIPEKMRQIHTWLEEHYADKISLEQLSEQFFISKYHLSREYKRIYGITLGNELTAIRLSHAKSMLRFENAPVETAAAACGFQSAGYFIKVFRKSENMTPAQYRRKW